MGRNLAVPPKFGIFQIIWKIPSLKSPVTWGKADCPHRFPKRGIDRTVGSGTEIHR